MLSEHHDINHEFPEFHKKLERMRLADKAFDSLVAKHDYIDDRIRRLEELQQPTSDEEMEKLKYERAALKDQVYDLLRKDV